MVAERLLLRNDQGKRLFLVLYPFPETSQHSLGPLYFFLSGNYSFSLYSFVLRLLVLEQFLAGLVLQLNIRYSALDLINFSKIKCIESLSQLSVLSLQLSNSFFFLCYLFLQIFFYFEALLVAILYKGVPIQCMHLHQLFCLLILLVIGAVSCPSGIQHLPIEFLCGYFARKLSMLDHLLFLTIVLSLHDGDLTMVAS